MAAYEICIRNAMRLLRRNMSPRPRLICRPCSPPEALAEIPGLIGQPVGVLLMRPALSHLFWHMGEVELLTQLAKASS